MAMGGVPNDPGSRALDQLDVSDPTLCRNDTWQEILRPDLEIQAMGRPVRFCSNFIRGIRSLSVRIAV